MKIILTIIIVLQFLVKISDCQTFEKVYRSGEDELVYDAVLTDSATSLFALNSGNNSSGIYYTKFFKIDLLTGNFIDSLIIEPEFQGCYFRGIIDLLKSSDSLYIGVGKFAKYGSGEEIQYLVHINNNLKVLFDTIVDIPDIEERFQKSILTHNNKLVSVGTMLNSNEYERLLCEKTIFADSIRIGSYSHPGSLTATAIVDLPGKNKYHMLLYGGIDRAINLIDKTTLESDTIVSYPIFFLPIDAVPDDIDSAIYYAAGKQGSGSSSNYDLSYLKLNDEGEILCQQTYFLNSNTFYTYKCLSPFNEHIYFGGVYPFTSSPPTLYPEPRWILLYKLTKDGTILWQKFYKGEVNYMVYKILSTPDNGAILFTTKYDWNDPIPNQRDVHILKIDSIGFYTPLTSTEEVFEQMNKQILVYPNPAKDKVNFVFGLYQNLEISIYNLMGELILSDKYKSSATIDISNLPAGTYIYKITGENGFYEEGKFVKQ